VGRVVCLGQRDGFDVAGAELGVSVVRGCGCGCGCARVGVRESRVVGPVVGSMERRRYRGPAPTARAGVGVYVTVRVPRSAVAGDRHVTWPRGRP
jgi:hypothetical protein